MFFTPLPKIFTTTISWSSKKQLIVALSSTEAEYRGTAVAVWLKRILKDLGVPIADPIRIFYNNMSNIYLARNPVFLVKNP